MPEPHLNGAYYGPSIPPPTSSSKSYHRPGRRRGDGGSCNPCGCLLSCLCNCVCQILCTLLVILGVLALVLWLVLRPNHVKFYVDDATLAQFDLSQTNNTLYYNLALNMTIRNPNKRIGVYYDHLEASAFYKGQRLGTENLETFYQGHKNTTNLSTAFRSQNIVSLDAGDKNRYEDEKTRGVYEIDVKLYLKIRLKVGWIKTRKIKPTIECDLKVPLQSNGRSSDSFERTRCHLDW